MTPKYHKEAITLCRCTKYPKELGATSFSDVEAIENKTELALLGYHPWTNTVHLAVRGTDDWIKQGKTNLDFIPETFKAQRIKYKACDGFFDATNMIIVPVLEKLRTYRHKYPDADVVLSGFSRGGAVVQLLLPFIPRVAEMHTFGSPRVYVKESAKRVKKLSSIFRWVNNNDVVTRLPPSVIVRHIGQLMYFTRKGRLLVKPKLRLIWHKFILGMFTVVDPFVDHSLRKGYYKLITSLNT